jgi:hypothetical protein
VSFGRPSRDHRYARHTGARATYGRTAGEGSDSVSGSGQSLFDKAREPEIRILGTILNSPEVFPNIKARLKPESFQHQKHRIIYRAMLELHDRSMPIDLLSLYDLLKEQGKLEEAGGSMYLSYPQAMLSSEQIARDEEESGWILELLRGGGTVKWEEGGFVYRNRNGRIVSYEN